MDFHAQEAAAEFQTGNQSRADHGLNREKPRQSCQRIVVRQRKGLETNGMGERGQNFWCVSSVRKTGMAMEIYHMESLTKWG